MTEKNPTLVAFVWAGAPCIVLARAGILDWPGHVPHALNQACKWGRGRSVSLIQPVDRPMPLIQPSRLDEFDTPDLKHEKVETYKSTLTKKISAAEDAPSPT